MAMHKAVLSVREVAELLGLHPLTVYQHLHSGVIPARRCGRKWLLSRAAIERFLDPPQKSAEGGQAA